MCDYFMLLILLKWPLAALAFYLVDRLPNVRSKETEKT